MATFNKFEVLSEYLANSIIDLFGTTHVVKTMLSNTTPDAGADVVRADAAEITAANGYTAGGEDTQNDGTRTGGTTTVTTQDIVWTATGGAINTFRFPIHYDDTPTSPADPLIGWHDYGSSIAPAVGETFTVDFGASFLTIA